MTRDSLPPKFKPWQAPQPEGLQRKENRGRHRNSPRKRGYNARWDRISMALRRSRPWCYFCMQSRPPEQWEMTAVADHVLPAHEFPELRYDLKNLVPLCSYHHDHTKQKLENLARKSGNLLILVEWVHNPASRPQELRPIQIFEPPKRW